MKIGAKKHLSARLHDAYFGSFETMLQNVFFEIRETAVEALAFASGLEGSFHRRMLSDRIGNSESSESGLNLFETAALLGSFFSFRFLSIHTARSFRSVLFASNVERRVVSDALNFASLRVSRDFGAITHSEPEARHQLLHRCWMTGNDNEQQKWTPPQLRHRECLHW